MLCIKLGVAALAADGGAESRRDRFGHPHEGTLGRLWLAQRDVDWVSPEGRVTGVDDQVRDDLGRAAFGTFLHHGIAPRFGIDRYYRTELVVTIC